MISQTRCLICGDFDFHMDACKPEAEFFQHYKLCKESLISWLRSSFEIPSDLASVTCCLALPRSPLIKVNTKRRSVRNIDLESSVEDLACLQVVDNPPSDLAAFVDAYHSKIRDLPDAKNADGRGNGSSQLLRCLINRTKTQLIITRQKSKKQRERTTTIRYRLPTRNNYSTLLTVCSRSKDRRLFRLMTLSFELANRFSALFTDKISH